MGPLSKFYVHLPTVSLYSHILGYKIVYIFIDIMQVFFIGEITLCSIPKYQLNASLNIHNVRHAFIAIPDGAAPVTLK